MHPEGGIAQEGYVKNHIQTHLGQVSPLCSCLSSPFPSSFPSCHCTVPTWRAGGNRGSKVRICLPGTQNILEKGHSFGFSSFNLILSRQKVAWERHCPLTHGSVRHRALPSSARPCPQALRRDTYQEFTGWLTDWRIKCERQSSDRTLAPSLHSVPHLPMARRVILCPKLLMSTDSCWHCTAISQAWPELSPQPLPPALLTQPLPRGSGCNSIRDSWPFLPFGMTTHKDSSGRLLGFRSGWHSRTKMGQTVTKLTKDTHPDRRASACPAQAQWRESLLSWTIYLYYSLTLRNLREPVLSWGGGKGIKVLF